MLKEEVALELRFESEIIEETSVCRRKTIDVMLCGGGVSFSVGWNVRV